jgi:hypothetical protein
MKSKNSVSRRTFMGGFATALSYAGVTPERELFARTALQSRSARSAAQRGAAPAEQRERTAEQYDSLASSRATRTPTGRRSP